MQDLSREVQLGRRIRARRRLLGLTLAELAGRCSLSLQQVHKYEIGANAIAAHTMWALARGLEVSIDYFFDGGEGSRMPSVSFLASNDSPVERLFCALSSQQRRALLGYAKEEIERAGLPFPARSPVLQADMVTRP